MIDELHLHEQHACASIVLAPSRSREHMSATEGQPVVDQCAVVVRDWQSHNHITSA